MKEETMNKTTKKRSRETVLVMRTCAADMTSYGGFKWPEKGPVSAPDWVDNYRCGNGLHSWLWGEGDGALGRCNDPDAKWLVVKVLAHDIRHGRGELIGKCKFPRGVVVHCGDRVSATAYITAHGAAGKAVIYGTATAGDRGTATAGDLGTATAGDFGTAIAGYKGTATAGEGGTATAGYQGTAMAGDGGTLQIKYYDTRPRIATAYVGENGIKPNTKYRLDDAHNFVEVI
jgi:hypothetical protein